jgi:hypothetical protein
VSKQPIDKAIDAMPDRSQTELARRLGVVPQVLVNWRKRGIPTDRVPDVEAATIERDANDRPIDGAVPKVMRHELRPDKPGLFPPPPKEERAAA